MRVGPLLISSVLLTPTANALEVFSPGQVATAEAFNQNFSELSNRIDQLDNHSGIQRTVDGVVMWVQSSRYGFYRLTSEQGVNLGIVEDGFPVHQIIYYSEKDCAGTPYYDLNFRTNEAVGHQYPAKRLSPVQVAYDGTRLLMTDESELIQLYAQSRQRGDQCLNTVSSHVAMELVANDPAVTGFPNSLPYSISGDETQLTVERSVGDPAGNGGTGNYAVYANGSKIGTVDYIPTSASHALYGVQLDGYEDSRVTLYRDGTYTGLNAFKEASISFVGSNCEGTPYIKVLDSFDTQWWHADRLDNQIIKNNGTYYRMSEQLYKMSSGEGSSRWSSGSCFDSSGTHKHGYRKLTETTAPDMPSFTPPITWDGYTAGTDYTSLPEAD